MKYDVAIVGASIAGLYTGWKLAASGRSVCIVDRRKAIGVPVRCGEATGNRKELARFVDVDEAWIAADIAGLAAHVNGSYSMTRRVADAGVVLHRDRFEQALAARAEQAGARVMLGSLVTGLTGGEAGLWTGVRLESGESVEADVVIGADGPESSVGRWAGITAQLRLADAFSAAQHRVQTGFCSDGCLHFFVGGRAMPRGYVWVFPKGNGEMSVGAGLYGPGAPGRTAKSYLDEFVKRHMPGAAVSTLITGCAPLAVCPRRLHRGNVVVVGDAARQVNPLTAGGIMNTLEAADLLVQCILRRRPCEWVAALAGYSRTWARTQRRQQKVFAVLQKVMLDCGDGDLVTLLKRADRMFGGKTDRARPFAWSVVDMVRMGVWLAGRAWRHRGALFG